MPYECPTCDENNNLEVVVTKWARVIQSNDENIETMVDEAKDQSDDWDNTSQMKCECGFSGPAQDFKIQVSP